MRDFRTMIFQALLVLGSGLFLSSCSGGGSTAPGALPGGISQGPVSAATQNVFVPNDIGAGLGSVTAYAASSSGNVPPALAITGSNTQSGPAASIAFDSTGNLYVANKGIGCASACIAEFAAGASGNVAPIRTLCGADTHLSQQLGGIALDASGNIYVANPPESILVFAANAAGNVAPIRTITGANTGLAVPAGIGLDSAGRIFVANKAGGSGTGSITEYAADASGNAAPVATIAGTQTGISNPTGLALDAAGNLYVTNVAPASISVFASGANGNVAPIRTIAGANTQLNGPAGIALDALGTIYVTGFVTTQSNGGTSAAGAVLSYAAGSAGNVAPVRLITGSNTQLGGVGMPAVH